MADHNEQQETKANDDAVALFIAQNDGAKNGGKWYGDHYVYFSEPWGFWCCVEREWVHTLLHAKAELPDGRRITRWRGLPPDFFGEGDQLQPYHAEVILRFLIENDRVSEVPECNIFDWTRIWSYSRAGEKYALTLLENPEANITQLIAALSFIRRYGENKDRAKEFAAGGDFRVKYDHGVLIGEVISSLQEEAISILFEGKATEWDWRPKWQREFFDGFIGKMPQPE